GAFCSYTLTGPQSFTGAAGDGTITVSASSGCAWNVKADAGWVTFPGASSGDGNGSVAFHVAANPTTTPRTARISIGNAVFTINQGGRVFTFPVAPLRITAPPAGGPSRVGFSVLPEGAGPPAATPGGSRSRIREAVRVTARFLLVSLPIP